MSRARTEEAKEERRTAILKAALSEFYEKGLVGSRLDDIAQAAGISKGTLYLYFDSKEDLFRGLIDHQTASSRDRMETVVGMAPSLEEALSGFAKLAPMLLQSTQMPAMFKILISESRTFPGIIKDHREQIIDKIYALFTKVLTDAQARGEIEIDDPSIAARLVIAPVIYSGIWKTVFEPGSPHKLNYETLFETHVKFLLKGMNYRSQTSGDGQ